MHLFTDTISFVIQQIHYNNNNTLIGKASWVPCRRHHPSFPPSTPFQTLWQQSGNSLQSSPVLFRVPEVCLDLYVCMYVCIHIQSIYRFTRGYPTKQPTYHKWEQPLQQSQQFLELLVQRGPGTLPDDSGDLKSIFVRMHEVCEMILLTRYDRVVPWFGRHVSSYRRHSFPDNWWTYRYNVSRYVVQRKTNTTGV